MGKKKVTKLATKLVKTASRLRVKAPPSRVVPNKKRDAELEDWERIDYSRSDYDDD